MKIQKMERRGKTCHYPPPGVVETLAQMVRDAEDLEHKVKESTDEKG